jgi:hypothetical protein
MTNLDLFKQEGHYPGPLKAGETFLFISKTGNQVVFIFRDPEVDFNGVSRRVVDSRRLRLGSGTWNPYMLQNYANSVGIKLEGIKSFEQIHEERKAAKRAARLA